MAESLEEFIRDTQPHLMCHMPKVWLGDDRCYQCPVKHCENWRGYLEQKPEPRENDRPSNVWGDGSW